MSSNSKFFLTVWLLSFYLIPGSAYSIPKEDYLLKQLETSKKAFFFKQSSTWNSLISLSWYYQEIGDHQKGIEYATQSLEIAKETNDPFMLGRSYCWIGWSLSELGRYLASKEAFQKAREYGYQDGRITIPMVWGLSQQELGYIHFKMGEVDEAKVLLKETYDYATKYRIDIGITESGSRLAEIANYQGRFSEASEYANTALAAGIRCSCGSNNVSRAKALLIQSRLEQGFEDQNLKDETNELIQNATPLYQAIGKVLLSKFKNINIDEKILLLTDAHNILINIDSDLQGGTEAEIGKALIDTELKSQSLTYLQNALSLNSDILRKVDDSWILLSKSAVVGDNSINTMVKSVDAAFNYDSSKDAYVALKTLFITFEKKRYYRSISDWSERFLKKFPDTSPEYILFFKTQIAENSLKIVQTHEEPTN